MLKWYLDRNRNMLNYEFQILTEYKIYSRKLGYHGIKMNAHPLPKYNKGIYSIKKLINDTVIS